MKRRKKRALKNILKRYKKDLKHCEAESKECSIMISAINETLKSM